jgi:hypothetical protein
MPVIMQIHIDRKIKLAKKICETSPASKECAVAWVETDEIITEYNKQKTQKATIERITHLMKNVTRDVV